MTEGKPAEPTLCACVRTISWLIQKLKQFILRYVTCTKILNGIMALQNCGLDTWQIHYLIKRRKYWPFCWISSSEFEGLFRLFFSVFWCCLVIGLHQLSGETRCLHLLGWRNRIEVEATAVRMGMWLSFITKMQGISPVRTMGRGQIHRLCHGRIKDPYWSVRNLIN